MSTAFIGKPQSRVDGYAKVTGSAKYAAEFTAENLTYGVVVSSGIAKGKITKIDSSEALSLPGVLQVFTHENIPGLAWFDRSYRDLIAPGGSPFRPLRDANIMYSLQPIALVVAENFELARFAATLIKVEYESEEPATDLNQERAAAYDPPSGRLGYVPPPKPRGKPEKMFAKAHVQHEAEYTTPPEHHNPMENFSSTVVYEADGTFTVYDKTQGVQNCQKYLRKVFNLSKDEVRVISPFVGGAFGSGLRPQYQVFLAVLAARELKRSVRVSLTRQQMFSFSYRSETRQKVALGSSEDGTLESVIHEVVSETSRFEDYTENIANWSGILYQCEHVKLGYKLAQLDRYTPCDMRAPGATQGVYALECAMDELAQKAGIDPIELRLKNYSEKNQLEGKPYSSKELRECYRQGAETFGWARRLPEPRSMRDGNMLVGYGMAGGIWESMQVPSSASAVLSLEGKLTVSSATSDIGTGTYTVMTQIAAETLGLAMEEVTFKLGDSSLPFSLVQGGSFTAASTGTAVKNVCNKLRKQLFKLARKMENSPLADADLEEVLFENGKMIKADDRSKYLEITDVLKSGDANVLKAKTTALPNVLKQHGYSRCAHSAVFVEVHVDEDINMIHIKRVVSAIAGGRILNPKTARSQIIGGVVWGISMALHEETLCDHKLGRFMNHSFAEYHIPVHADIPDIDVIFVKEEDDIVNPLGIKGLGEIGIVGTAAAVANAVFHATGTRVRDLPITLDKLMR